MGAIVQAKMHIEGLCGRNRQLDAWTARIQIANVDPGTSHEAFDALIEEAQAFLDEMAKRRREQVIFLDE